MWITPGIDQCSDEGTLNLGGGIPFRLLQYWAGCFCGNLHRIKKVIHADLIRSLDRQISYDLKDGPFQVGEYRHCGDFIIVDNVNIITTQLTQLPLGVLKTMSI